MSMPNPQLQTNETICFTGGTSKKETPNKEFFKRNGYFYYHPLSYLVRLSYFIRCLKPFI